MMKEYIAMKKEKHPVYAAVLVACVLLLLLGVALFVLALGEGPGRVYVPGGQAI